jgi:TPR repeat protein
VATGLNQPILSNSLKQATRLGVLYEVGGGGLPKDEREAARLYKLAADQGDPYGQVHLGYFYQTCRGGLPKDKEEAARLYKLAEQGDPATKTALKRRRWQLHRFFRR